MLVTVEYKQPKELSTESKVKKAITQELNVAQALESTLYVVTDGSKTYWINASTGNRIVDSTGVPVDVVFDKGDSRCINVIKLMLDSINEDNDTLKEPEYIDPLPLAQRVWQDLWMVTGATPENCLYTFVEVFIFKYLSDLKILRGMYSFDHLLSLYSMNNDEEVLNTYVTSIRPEIKRLFPGNEKDHTTIINGTIFVSKDDKAVSGYASVFRKILYNFKETGVLNNIDYDFKSKLFETFLKESMSKKNWGQFFTPLKVVRSIVKMADIKPGMSICDPACGVGKFLLEPVLQDLDKFYKIENGKLYPQVVLKGFDKGFDKDEQKTIILAKANMLIYLSSLIKNHTDMTTQFAKVFNDTFFLQTNSVLGTLSSPAVEEYDLILTNPPYVMNGSAALKAEINKDINLRKHYSINGMGVEGLFMEWIVRALKPSGKAFIVVPDGIMNRSNDRKLRDFIRQECVIDAIISLPLNTFFKTDKKTFILVLTKKETQREGHSPKSIQTDPIFTYLCSEIGESRDSYRFDIAQNDLAKAVELFNMFKGAKSFFTTDDPRCKIMDPSYLSSDTWIVDKLWTREEKELLGIEEQKQLITLEDFISLLTSASSEIEEFEGPLSDLLNEELSGISTTEYAVSDLFNVGRGDGKYTKRHINSHKGTIPVYSGSTLGPFDFVDVSEYDAPCLSWSIDGLAGHMMVHNEPFAATNHRGILLPLVDNLDLNYIKQVLEPIMVDSKKGREGDNGANEYTSLPPFMVKDLRVNIPVDEDGNIDLELQRKVSKKLQYLEEIKEILEQRLSYIESVSISVQYPNLKYGHFKLNDIFDLRKGSSKYTKKYGMLHSGSYPVYSAADNPLTNIDTYEYDGRYLTWSTNGLAGKMMFIDGKFSINGDRAVMIPKVTNLDLDYVRYVLEPLFRKNAKGRLGDRGKDEFTKLYVSMVEDMTIDLPVKNDGAIDLDSQLLISSRYRQIYSCKSEICKIIRNLINQNVTMFNQQ